MYELDDLTKIVYVIHMSFIENGAMWRTSFLSSRKIYRILEKMVEIYQLNNDECESFQKCFMSKIIFYILD